MSDKPPDTNVVPLRLVESTQSSDTACCVEYLRSMADRIESGDFPATKLYVVALTDTNGDFREITESWVGLSALERVGLLNVIASRHAVDSAE